MPGQYEIKPPAEFLEKDEVLAIIKAVPSVSLHPERDQLFLRTMWETGGRVSEVNHLIKGRILDSDLVIVLQNLKQDPIPKGLTEKVKEELRAKKSIDYKKPYVSKSLIDDLLTYCREHSIGNGDKDWVFQGNKNPSVPLGRHYIWWIVKKAAKEAGVEKFSKSRGRKVYSWPHLFRHACAMFLLDRTGSTEKAQRQLGHKFLVTTQAYAILRLKKSDKEISDLDWG